MQLHMKQSIENLFILRQYVFFRFGDSFSRDAEEGILPSNVALP